MGAYANEDLEKSMIETICAVVSKSAPDAPFELAQHAVYNSCGPLSWAVWQHMAKQQDCDGFDSPIEPIVDVVKEAWCWSLGQAKDQGPTIEEQACGGQNFMAKCVCEKAFTLYWQYTLQDCGIKDES